MDKSTLYIDSVRRGLNLPNRDRDDLRVWSPMTARVLKSDLSQGCFTFATGSSRLYLLLLPPLLFPPGMSKKRSQLQVYGSSANAGGRQFVLRGEIEARNDEIVQVEKRGCFGPNDLLKT